MRLALLVAVTLLGFSVSVQAAGYHSCSGKIRNLTTRATSQGTQVELEGVSGKPEIGFGGSSQLDIHQRQFSMLLSAFMADKSVTLEFEDNTMSCSDSHNGLLIRYVRLQQ